MNKMEKYFININLDVPYFVFKISDLCSDKDMEDVQAVYILVNNNEIIYIGQTINLRRRMVSHYRKVKDGFIDDKTGVIFFADEFRRKLESSLLWQYGPSGNGKRYGGDGHIYASHL